MKGKRNTRFDNLLEAVKNNKFFSVIILCGLALAGIAGFTDSLQKIYHSFPRKNNKVLGVSISIFNNGQNVSEDSMWIDLVKERTLTYKLSHSQDTLFIDPEMPYLSKLKSKTPVSPVSTFDMVDPLPLPTIDLKIVNNTEYSIFFTNTLFQIQESIIDPWPILVIEEGSPMHIPIFNLGWGDVYDGQAHFNVVAPSDPPSSNANYKYHVDVGTFSTSYVLDLRDAFSKEGVDVENLTMRWVCSNCGENHDIHTFLDKHGKEISLTTSELHQRVYHALGRFKADGEVEYNSGKATVYGEFTFIGRQANGQFQADTLKFVTEAYLYQWGDSGAGMPIQGEYNVEFETDRSDYEKSVPISHALKPGESDRFTMAIRATKSSVHKFKIQLEYNDGQVYESKPIVLKMFIPNYQ